MTIYKSGGGDIAGVFEILIRHYNPLSAIYLFPTKTPQPSILPLLADFANILGNQLLWISGVVRFMWPGFQETVLKTNSSPFSARLVSRKDLFQKQIHHMALIRLLSFTRAISHPTSYQTQKMQWLCIALRQQYIETANFWLRPNMIKRPKTATRVGGGGCTPYWTISVPGVSEAALSLWVVH